MRLILFALLLLLGACGGGQSDEGTGPDPGRADLISGTVVDAGGQHLANVQILLSGDALASTATDADGSYSFVGVANGTYVVAPIPAGASYEPEQRTVELRGTARTDVNFTQTAGVSPTTRAIEAKVLAAHTAFADSFQKSEADLGNQLASEGRYLAYAHYTLSAASYHTLLQSFVDEAVQTALDIAATEEVNWPAVRKIISDWAYRDVQSVSYYYRSERWGLGGTALEDFVRAVGTDTDAVYAGGLSRLP